MKPCHLILITTVVLLVALTTSASALEPAVSIPRAVMLEAGPLPQGDHSGIPQGANDCPADNVGTLTDGDTIVGSTIGSSDNFPAPCGSNPGGQDEIFEFQVDLPGVWSLDSCTVPACWDTTLSIHEETGGGCPGDIVACDGDGCNVCYYDSLVSSFLVPSSTYYLIVDGWSEFAYGSFTITAFLVVPGCTDDAACDDGIFCNGQETCITATGQCVQGDPPCLTYEGYTAPCDEDARDSCPKPEPWFTWIADKIGSGYFFPESNHCPDFASWVFDDIQNSHHTTGVLDYYTTPLVARSTPPGASTLGTVFLVNQALFSVTPGACIPQAEIAGTQCTQAATVDPQGAPPHLLPCSGTMPDLPNNAGDFGLCEIDFWMAYRTSENGAGMLIAGNYPTLGGLAGTDEFGVRVIGLENCPPTGDYSTITFFGDDVNLPADFEQAEVCQKAGGSCCCPDGSCTQSNQADCEAAGCSFGATGTINGTDGGCGGDPDGDGVYNRCGDNCENTANPGQEDCDADGEGDACEADDCDKDDDGDGVCNCVDNCLNTPNAGQEDKDGDGKGDACDICPNSDPDDADGDGVCGDVDKCEGFDDNDDADGDGVPGNGGCNPPSNSNGCDCCADHDDGIAGSLGDDDGDGVLNCDDLCNGVDDAVFAPECDGRIPTVSEWGLVVLALLLLVAGKVYFGRRQSLA